MIWYVVRFDPISTDGVHSLPSPPVVSSSRSNGVVQYIWPHAWIEKFGWNFHSSCAQFWVPDEPGWSLFLLTGALPYHYAWLVVVPPQRHVHSSGVPARAPHCSSSLACPLLLSVAIPHQRGHSCSLLNLLPAGSTTHQGKQLIPTALAWSDSLIEIWA